jgi:2-polyprenyl-3-methyl-5-hydroxy-6-metoxy-1,4-benzoquinol methylase
VTVSYDASYVEKYDAYPTEEMSKLRLDYLLEFATEGRLLDFGYGKGDFVKAASEHFDAYGYDIHGLDFGVQEGSLDDQWDVVTFYDSLEHLPDLSIAERLAENAKLVIISTPKPPKSFPKDRSWRHYKPGEHLHYFSIDSLRCIVNKSLIAHNNI